MNTKDFKIAVGEARALQRTIRKLYGKRSRLLTADGRIELRAYRSEARSRIFFMLCRTQEQVERFEGQCVDEAWHPSGLHFREKRIADAVLICGVDIPPPVTMTLH